MTPIRVRQELQEAAKKAQYEKLCAKYMMKPAPQVKKDSTIVASPPVLDEQVQPETSQPSASRDVSPPCSSPDAGHHPAGPVTEAAYGFDEWGQTVPERSRVDFYGRPVSRTSRSPSPQAGPVKRYRLGSFVVDGRRLPGGGFQALRWVSGPGLEAPNGPSSFTLRGDI